MFSDIQVAVIGTGFIGPVHVEALRRLGIRVKGILGSDPDRSRKAAMAMGLEKGFATYEEILAAPEITAVHITTPNVLHFEMAREAILAGKHVMCEKPLAMTSQETSILTDMARKSGLMAGVTYNVRFYPMNLEARVRCSTKEMGEIFSITGSYVQDWLLYDSDYNWRVLSDKAGALRAVADIGTHWMDLVQSITGLDVVAVFAHLQTVHSSRWKPLGEVQTFSGGGEGMNREAVSIDTEDAGSILFRFNNGAIGTLWVSQVTAGQKNRIRYEIAGSKMSLAWDSDIANQLFIGHRDRSNERLEKDSSLASSVVSPFISYPGGHSEGFPDTFKQCFSTFYRSVLSGKRENLSFPSFEEGHREVVLCEAILESHKNHSWVNVP